ncbi:MAG TPA: hypothetical protein PKN33_10335 [Phycisphaerae bacterium]|nr:hypothetical protein [Phycisphaerae bacterium]
MSDNRGGVGSIARRSGVLVAIFGLALTLVGCKEESKVQPPSDSAVVNSASPSDSQTNGIDPPNADVLPESVRFAKGVFFKPDVDAPADDMWMAPLIVAEVHKASDASTEAPFGSLTSNASKLPGVDCTKPAVYSFHDTVELNGVRYRRATYVWFYPIAPSKALSVSGVAVVSNEDNEPILWHVFDTARAGKDQIYIAHSVEHNAKLEHGPPLAGRRFAVETSDPSSSVDVVRIIEDGPEPMGPMVYVAAEPRHVATLACRCMNSQVDEILDARFYRLIQLETNVAQTGSLSEQVQNFFETNGITLDERLEAFLSRDLNACLRLPATL